MVVNGIVQRCRAADKARMTDLGEQILTFLASYENERVELHSHSDITDRDEMAFYRYQIELFELIFEGNQGKERGLPRILSGTSEEDPQCTGGGRYSKQSMPSHMSTEEDHSQKQDPGAQR